MRPLQTDSSALGYRRAPNASSHVRVEAHGLVGAHCIECCLIARLEGTNASLH